MTASHDLDDHLDTGAQPAPDSGRAVREFEAICMKHSLACGAPENLAPFLTALGENKLLAMNFWSAVARLHEPKFGALPQDRVLAAIVRAVTGQEVDQAGESQAACVDSLGRLLAGEDVSLGASLTADPPQPAPSAEVVPANALDPAAGTDPATTAPPERAIEPIAEQTSEPLPDSSSPASSNARLVLSPEPPRSLAAAIAAASEMEEATPVEPPAAGIQSEPTQPHLAAPQPTGQDTLATSELPEEPRLFIPLSSYAAKGTDHSHTSGSVAIAVLLVGLISAGGFLIARNRAALHHTVASWLPGRSAGPQSSPLATSQPTTGNAATTSTAASVPRPAASPFPAAPMTAEHSSATPPTPTVSATQPAPYSGATHRIISRDAGAADGAAAPADGADAARDAGLPHVSADEMRSHLISSRFPIVPDAANADAISGVVTLHAVITANGTVEHAYAISGPEFLRQPAIEAVSSWRYRPYLVDGAPTDVSTTIRVDFSGND